MTHLLDSVIVIDHSNGVAEASALLARVHGRACVSVITRAEVLVGFDAASAVRALPLLDAFATLGIERGDADLAATLRRLHRWKLPDALQAALAVRYGLRLVTRNTRDFDPVRHAFAEVPYVL